MTPVEALQLALSNEEQAIATYQKLAREHTEISELLYFLVTEEEKHKKLVEKKIVELTRP